MKPFVYHNPTKIIFGENAITTLGTETAALGHRCLLVYGKNSIKPRDSRAITKIASRTD
jgi:alcohol dehydrogenase YqhD (iron-dependent ADH family)